MEHIGTSKIKDNLKFKFILFVKKGRKSMRSWQLLISYRLIHIWTYAITGGLEITLQSFVVKSLSLFTFEHLLKKNWFFATSQSWQACWKHTNR